MLDYVLGSVSPIVQGGPLQCIIPETVGLGNGASLALHQSLQLLQITIRRCRVDIVTEHFITSGDAFVFNDLNLRRHFVSIPASHTLWV